jgi:hypothetical protein
MKKINIILFAILGLVFTSCQTNVITFSNETVDVNKFAELRLLNVIPVTGNSDTLLLNHVNFSSVNTGLGSYYPVSTPKYFIVPFGNDSISLHFMAKTTTPTVAAFMYKGMVPLTKGKWSAYVYNAAQNPILLQDADNVPVTDAWADTVCFVKVANFFMKSDGVTPFGKITLKAKKNIVGADWETLATNIDFGTQSSDYYIYRLKNTLNSKPWSGTESNITIAIFDSNGVQYQSFSSATLSTKGAYSSTGWGLGKGRAYVIYLNGKEGVTNSTTQFIRLGSYNPL